MLIFGLRSTSDDWLSNLSNESRLKCDKSPPKSIKMKNSFLYYVQLPMIGQVIQATKVDQNAKKRLLNQQKMKCLFLDYIQLLMIGCAI